ncbi:hypothetical protein P4S72_05900 [Vibrio sp. PP-XX7]
MLDYGAVGDGVTVNTQSIQKAIDACSKDSKSAYGCKVIIPAARPQHNSQSPVFVSGALFLNSNMTLDIEKGATLKGSTNAEDYPLNQGYQLYSYKTNATDSRRPPSLLNVLSADHRNGSVNEQQGYDARRDTFKNIRVVGGGTLMGADGRNRMKAHSMKPNINWPILKRETGNWCFLLLVYLPRARCLLHGSRRIPTGKQKQNCLT